VAEFNTFDTAFKEALWTRKTLKALNLPINGPCTGENEVMRILTDSDNSMKILRRGSYMPVTRWLDSRYLFVRDILTADDAEFRFISGSTNIADLLTKSLEKDHWR
jgi:hypothetical protein